MPEAFTGFALLAFALAAIGLFSVVSYVVAQRTNEFGIRMALGAAPGRVLQLVFASTTREVIAGMGLGVMLSVLLGRFLSQWAEASSQNTILFGPKFCRSR